jgi:hypothetical protein
MNRIVYILNAAMAFQGLHRGAVGIPLAIVGFRVNQITDKFTPWFGSSSNRPRGSYNHTTNDENKDDDDTDYDNNGSDDSDYDGTTTSNHTILSAVESYNSSVDSVWNMPQDARLFGRWNFPCQIPLRG